MRWCVYLLLTVVLFEMGCSRSGSPILQPGDFVRPEIAFAPAAPWRAGASVVFGMLVKVDRPGAPSRYLQDSEVRDSPAMQLRITFLDGERQLGDPLELPFIRDC